VNGKFYNSLTLNEMILAGKKVGLFEVDPRCYIPLKSQRQISAYELASGE